MTSRVVITEPALADASDILTGLARDAGIVVMDGYLSKFRRVADILAEFPDAGALRPRLGGQIRIYVVAPYVFIYRHDPGAALIEILRVVHGRRRIARPLLKTPDHAAR